MTGMTKQEIESIVFLTTPGGRKVGSSLWFFNHSNWSSSFQRLQSIDKATIEAAKWWLILNLPASRVPLRKALQNASRPLEAGTQECWTWLSWHGFLVYSDMPGGDCKWPIHLIWNHKSLVSTQALTSVNTNHHQTPMLRAIRFKMNYSKPFWTHEANTPQATHSSNMSTSYHHIIKVVQQQWADGQHFMF